MYSLHGNLYAGTADKSTTNHSGQITAVTSVALAINDTAAERKPEMVAEGGRNFQSFR